MFITCLTSDPYTLLSWVAWYLSFKNLSHLYRFSKKIFHTSPLSLRTFSDIHYLWNLYEVNSKSVNNAFNIAHFAQVHLTETEKRETVNSYGFANEMSTFTWFYQKLFVSYNKERPKLRTLVSWRQPYMPKHSSRNQRKWVKNARSTHLFCYIYKVNTL